MAVFSRRRHLQCFSFMEIKPAFVQITRTGKYLIISTKDGLIHRCPDLLQLLIINQGVHLNCFRADGCVVISTAYHFPTCLLKHVVVPIQCNCDCEDY